jgi:hypothetical protein
MDNSVYLYTQMTPKITTTALVLATFALVGSITAGASQTVFAQTVTDPLSGATDPLSGGFLDEFLPVDDQTGGTTDGTTDGTTTGSTTGGGSITDEPERTEETQSQTTSQDESNVQSNSIDQDQTGAINQEIGSGDDSEVASAASSDSASDSESTYKTKYKGSDGSTTSSYPGSSTSSSDSASDSFSDVSNTGTLGQNQELNNPTQVNTNNAGDDESRGAVVGFDLGFEQFTEQGSSVPGTGTSVPIIIP